MTSGDGPDYADLWRRLGNYIEGSAELARDDAHRARKVRTDEELLDYHRSLAEADAFARMLSMMDEMAPEAAW